MTPTRTVDLNVDAGESFGSWKLGQDERLFPFVTSANLACGFHAGDPLTMQKAIALAQEHGVQVGAHPGLRDLVGFGRRELAARPEEIHAETLYQLGALAALLHARGMRLRHVSPHGALGWMTWKDEEIARAVVRAVLDFATPLALLVLGGTVLEEVARREGVETVRLGFPERGYLPDGRLAPRGTEGAVITDPEHAAERAVQMVTEGRLAAVDGSWIEVEAGSLLIHGDNPAAPAIARRVREALTSAGVEVRAL